MKVITQRTLIREVATRWREQYPAEKEILGSGSTSGDIHRRLSALDPEQATVDDVEAIIGNRSWTQVPACNECGKHAPAVVMLGEDPDYESSTAWVCEACLERALAAMTVAPRPAPPTSEDKP